PTKGFIDIAIADTGIGIFQSYDKTSKFNPANEAEAIEMAVNGHSTKDRAESRGFGLSTSREMITREFGGTFLLWSGETMFVDKQGATPNIIHVDDGAFYKGCFICLRLLL